MPRFTELDGDQIRQMINSEQAYAAFRAAQDELDQRFRGSMSWKSVSGRQYLYRKSAGGQWRSLGRRSADTEHILDRFHSGRTAARRRIASLDAAIRRLAPVNRAMRLGRLPGLAARVIRKLDRKRLLGRTVTVVGTHALFAYERMAGGHFDSAQIATRDIDLLYDARRRIGLLAPDVRQDGLHGLLRSVDRSFETATPGGFRAINDAGFMVDLIRSMPASPAFGDGPSRIGTDPDDMTAAEIEGLTWLQNSPQLQQIVIDERGFPVMLAVPDPRAFALHKLWVSERPDRDRIKSRRDAEQARAVAWLVNRYLPQLRFDDPALGALPETVRARAPALLAEAAADPADREDW